MRNAEKKLTNIIQHFPSDIDKLHEEFFEYQLLTDEEIHPDVWEDAVSKIRTEKPYCTEWTWYGRIYEKWKHEMETSSLKGLVQ